MAKQHHVEKPVTNKHLRTSIGRSPNSRPTNKSKRLATGKAYRGQG